MRRRFLNNIKSISGDNHSEYFTIEALEDVLTANLSTNACEYRIDNGSWNTLSAGSNTPSINKGQTLSFRGNITPTSSKGIGTFTISKKCNLKGNIMSLLYGDDFIDKNDLTGKNYAFYKLFYNSTNIVDVSELLLPATTLAGYCYSYMFSGCTSLTTAPALPATTLANNCYSAMFNGCTNLTTAPELPATTLASECYSAMFSGCISLTTAPALPATTLSSYCYQNMFYYCKGLTTAPALPATTLATYCYRYMFSSCTGLTTAPALPATKLISGCYHQMFSGCRGLTTAPALPATTLSSYCYQNMFYGCTSLTTAPALPATTLAIYCYQNMFYGCTSLTTAPALPATTLANNCYANMFSGCRGLTTAPELPATTLAIYCYANMFSGCRGLTTAPALPATTLKDECYESMFSGCTSLTTAPALPATKLADYCYNVMFNGCTGLTTAPALPATKLADYCYRYMFNGCTGLTTAPELPATTLTSYCYDKMFYGCSKLNYIKMLATDISASQCLSNWVYNVASTGTFVKHYNMTSLPNGINGIPSGWTVEDNITILDCISLEIIADDVSGRNTNTTIYYTAQLNALDVDGNQLVITRTGTTISEEFPQNTSETESINRTITFTYMGVTATTTITQGVWVNNSYTVTLNGQWQLSDKPNPDASLYDGVYESFSNKGVDNQAAIMYIDMFGYTNFNLYIRSYAESNYDYVMVSQLDQDITNSTSYSNTALVKAYTRGNQQSGTALSNYTRVQFTNIDSGNHRITIVYRKDSSASSGDDKGYVLIEKT